jgi:DNA-binding CsgD family transcriptional regulator
MTAVRVSLSASWNKLPAVLADFYADGLAVETYTDRVFALIGNLVPVTLQTRGVLTPANGQLAARFDRPLPGLAGAFEAFGRHMRAHEPMRFNPDCYGGKPYSLRDFYSQRALENTDFYQEIYHPLRFADQCFAHVPSNAGEVVFVGLFRDGGMAFDTADKELLAALQPHLINAHRLAQAVSAGRELPLSPELFCRAGFTPRESEVLFWLTQGKTTNDIAALLRIRSDSVRAHITTLYDKLGVGHRASAATRAIKLARRQHLKELAEHGNGVPLQVATR